MKAGALAAALAALAALAAASAHGQAPSQTASQAASQAPPGPALKRTANMPDGAPAFDVLDARGARVARIECIYNGWYEADALAARLMGAPGVMAAIIAKNGRITITDLGPAVFDCVVAPPATSP